MPDSNIAESVGASLFRNRSNDIAKLAASLALAQKAFAPIPKDREVTVQTQTGGTYKFKYATLDAIRSATMPALSEQGLAIVQGMTGDGKGLETTLYHSSGEWLSNVTPMLLSGKRGKDGQTYPPGNQELGSAQTYARRYGISALLCITADEDDDGNTADGGHIEGASGSASGGGNFRPNGSRKFTGGRVGSPEAKAEAAKDGLTTNPPATRSNGTASAIKRVEWCKASTEGLKAMQGKGEPQEWWKSEAERLAVIEENLPAEYERLIAAYDAAVDRTSARAA